MNRRSFLGDLALGLSAAIFLPRTIAASKWHRVPGRVLFVINPEWVTAPYEMQYTPALFHGKWDFVSDSELLLPIRFSEHRELIPPFIPQPT